MGVYIPSSNAVTLPAFVTNDHYVTVDSSGNFHRSAIGPAS